MTWVLRALAAGQCGPECGPQHSSNESGIPPSITSAWRGKRQEAMARFAGFSLSREEMSLRFR